MQTKIKICGITTQADARAAVLAGADALGLVFYAESPRAVDIETAAAIVKSLPPFISTVGLFVNAEASFIQAVLEAVPLSLLQFHGDETEADCMRFNRPYIKAIRVKADMDINHHVSLFPSAQAYLLDAYHPERYGGSGRTFDWSSLPPRSDKPFILAGGLNPDNVRAAILTVHPYAVDVSSGVELRPGVKDQAKLTAFCQAVWSS